MREKTERPNSTTVVIMKGKKTTIEKKMTMILGTKVKVIS